MSRRYLSGETRNQAITQASVLSTSGYRLTFDLLGEEVEETSQADQALAEYESLLQDLLAAKMEINLSIKPSQFGMGMDWATGVERARQLGKNVLNANGFLRWEMESSDTVDATLEGFSALQETCGAAVGCVLQSMLRRTAQDARSLIDGTQQLNVRLVKGIYVEPPEIAFQEPATITKNYVEVMTYLLEGGAFVGVATHDPEIIKALKNLLESHPEYMEKCEVQMLLGVQERLRMETRKAGIPVRVYLPYGPAWRAYVLRRLRKNPRLAGLAFQGMFGGRERLKA